MNKPVRSVDMTGARGKCVIDGCDEIAYAKHLCVLHFKRTCTGTPMDFPIWRRGANRVFVECSVDECTEEVKAKGLCHFHYARKANGTPMDAPKLGTFNLGACSVGWCDRSAEISGLCALHYERHTHGRDMDAPVRAKHAKGEIAFCEFPGCGRKWVSRGYCYTHYEQKYIKKIKLRAIRLVPDMTTCSITGCSKEHKGAALCLNHMQRARKYGLSGEQLNMLLLRTVCDSCGLPFGKKRKRHIDHDHSCCPGKRSCGECVRGVLCSSCNTGLGMFEDSRVRLSAAVTYLERTQLAA